MLKSMTAFARGHSQTQIAELHWELRSVNHRYLELFFRLPEELKALENTARDVIQQRLGRGKIECSLKYKLNEQAISRVQINTQMVQAVLDACNEIDMQMGQGVALNALDVLQYPGVVIEGEPQFDDLQQSIFDSLHNALDDLIASREREGVRLEQLLKERVAEITQIISQVRQRRNEVNAAVREKLLRRMQDIRIDVDQGRLEQEFAIILQKMDVDEELDRMDAHVKELHAIFKRDEPVGRRLDFLMQEFNREANTLGSKSSDIETTRAAVELKVLIEQMREQVQNIE